MVDSFVMIKFAFETKCKVGEKVKIFIHKMLKKLLNVRKILEGIANFVNGTYSSAEYFLYKIGFCKTL